MLYLITQLMECSDCRTVDNLVTRNIFELPWNQRSKLTIFANHRKMHILRLQAQKKDTYKLHIN
jgi:hypothetical protein